MEMNDKKYLPDDIAFDILTWNFPDSDIDIDNGAIFIDGKYWGDLYDFRTYERLDKLASNMPYGE